MMITLSLFCQHSITRSLLLVHLSIFLYALCALGEYTTLLDCIFGNNDHFAHTDSTLLETKLLLLQGDPDLSVKLDSYLQTHQVPIDALAYPMYMVDTVSLASDDVGMHCLHSEVYFCPQQNHLAAHRFRRGYWL